MQQLTKFWKSGIFAKIVIIVIPILTACCLCFLVFMVLPGPTPDNSSPVSTRTPRPADQPQPTSTPRPTEQPTQQPLGETRDHPYPTDAIIDIGGGMQFSIVNVTRPADDLVQQGNQFNSTPVPGTEYALVRIHIECQKASEEKCSFYTSELSAVGSDGRVHEIEFAAGIPEELEYSAEFFGGSSIEGNLLFIIPQGDEHVVLFHEPLLFGDPVYIALP